LKKNNQNMLYQLDNLVEASVVKRPSKQIKTPYVADVLLNNKEVLGHSPALGCGGLADAGSTIFMIPANEKSKCDYTLYLSEVSDEDHPEEKIIVGIHPKMAETLMEICLTQNMLSKLQNIRGYRRETNLNIPNLVHSRFDFTGVDETGRNFILEVKNVPLADYEDLPAKERKHKNYKDRDFHDKVAYFPDGYRKKRDDPISPRALKHVQELTKIRKISNVRCLLGFVIQRSDVSCFQASVIDPQYREAVRLAIDAGVEIFAMVIQWNKEGQATFVTDQLPIL
jgi:DNA-binding sugar fermentation-stimulating protein